MMNHPVIAGGMIAVYVLSIVSTIMSIDPNKPRTPMTRGLALACVIMAMLMIIGTIILAV